MNDENNGRRSVAGTLMESALSEYLADDVDEMSEQEARSTGLRAAMDLAQIIGTGAGVSTILANARAFADFLLCKDEATQ